MKLEEIITEHSMNSGWADEEWSWHCNGTKCNVMGYASDGYAEHVAEMWREACTIRTVEALDTLPVGSIVMVLWDTKPLHYAMQRYSDGWFSPVSPRERLYPLGATEDNGVLLIWHPDWETP